MQEMQYYDAPGGRGATPSICQTILGPGAGRIGHEPQSPSSNKLNL